MSTATDAITRAAHDVGVDPALALAIAQQESGYNPAAVGDNGCSYGLFQLNTCGGEGAGMTLQQLLDPYTNARRALTEVANVARQHPDWSPGQLAAAAQRPANPGAYAQSVQAIWQGIVGGAEAPGKAVVQAVAGGSNPLDAVTGALSGFSAWASRTLWLVAGGALIGLGLLLIVFNDFEGIGKAIASAAVQNPELVAA